ncbi:putative HTH-type transcriptional regulator YbaQ [Acaryochloris thomasi RCC1774]|uniref:Putative HTH-type transcriptional regulator YbaQ n=1 Tax=Acaryochloris thomasi RCC1774 TaxID=1764569 RepID=A0A2W1J6R2_9CYAN|nr:HigA family addiction module antitoxin [Acaryochloris thomasi]PZD70250.1 putative HTH-type transcriptional regulator YbaQ [Acaryochloris thomasi RCC1774]
MLMHSPPHPGESLQEIYMEPYGLSVRDIAKVLGVSHSTVARLVSQQSAVTPDMAIRLEKGIGMTAGAWLGMQQDHDLWLALQNDCHEDIQMINFEQLASAG